VRATLDGSSIRDRLRRRDPEALREVIEHIGPRVHAVVRNAIGDDPLIHDVMQETFLALWRAPDRFDPGRGSLSTFLCTIARNKAIDLVRREGRQRRNASAIVPSIEASMEPVWEDRRAVVDALARLTYLQREALFLAYFRGLPYREVARVLSVPEGTAKTRLRDGLRALRTSLGGSVTV
jgi:RNA polymerase sigma factor (sigma-70 family)